MSTLIESQIRDALTYMEGLSAALKALPNEPAWGGGGQHLVLPAYIPLMTDSRSDIAPVAWLVANDFDGYDLTTTDPSPKENNA
jgi:hypothetical protein